MAKFVGSFKMLKVKNYNLVIDVYGESITVNLDQVKVCRFTENGSEGTKMSTGISQILRSYEFATFSS